jgi:hypothetical protein
MEEAEDLNPVVGVGMDFQYVREETVNDAALASRTGDLAALKVAVCIDKLFMCGGS